MPNNLSVSVPTKTLLELLQEAVTRDFGTTCHTYHPFCPSCIAQQAVTMLKAVYEDVELDAIVQRIVDEREANTLDDEAGSIKLPTKH